MTDEVEPGPAGDAAPDPLLLEYVRDRDVACPVCGYNVRNLTTPRCPECGEQLALHLAPVEPKLGLWLAMLVPLLLGAGLGLLFIILWSFKGSPSRREMPVIVSFILCVPLAAVAIATRRRFMRLGRGVRISLAVWSAVLLVALMTWTLIGIG